MIESDKIIQRLPYGKNFLFADSIIDANDDIIIGEYTFRPDNFIYSGHFNDKLIIPGVIVLECMGQIGMVSHIVYFKLKEHTYTEFYPVVVTIESDFYHKIIPGERMIVKGEKKYYTNNLLRSEVTMSDEKNKCYAKLNALIKVTEKNEL